MKQLLLVTVFLCLGLNCFAQKIRFTDTTNKWTVLKITFSEPSATGEESFGFGRDTAISGMVYHRLQNVNYPNASSVLFSPLALREDSGRIYFRLLKSITNSA